MSVTEDTQSARTSLHSRPPAPDARHCAARCSARGLLLTAVLLAAGFTVPPPAEGQESRRRWERMCQIRAEKFDLVLPKAMQDNDLDMWIVVMREGLLDPLWEALGRGYVGDWAYYVFTNPGDGGRVERAALGVGGYMLQQCGVYDRFAPATALAAFVAERDPDRIGVNMAPAIGGADGLSHSSYLHLKETLGPVYGERLVSAERSCPISEPPARPWRSPPSPRPARSAARSPSGHSPTRSSSRA